MNVKTAFLSIGALTLIATSAASLPGAVPQATRYQAWADRNGNGVIDTQDQDIANSYYAANMGASKRPTATPIPPTATTVPATLTPVPPTATAVPPTATSQPSATPTTVPTVAPTATHVHTAVLDECGNDASMWHAPCLHEHGDAPPAWLVADGIAPNFNHAHGTGPAENSMKHAFMKGVRLVDSRVGIEAYGVLHGAGVAQERVGQFHSSQVWIKDSTGGISYVSYWNDYGRPCLWNVGDATTNDCGRMLTHDDFNNRASNQGAIRIVPGEGLEQWYVRPHGATPDQPMLFQVTELFSYAEVFTPGVTTAPQIVPGAYITENLRPSATTRRYYEVIWHRDRFDTVPVGVPVLMSQFGFPETAARCADAMATVTHSGVSYRLQCAQWFVTPQLKRDVAALPFLFGGQSLRLTNEGSQYFDTSTVTQPN